MAVYLSEEDDPPADYPDQWLRDLQPAPREPTWGELAVGSVVGAGWVGFVVGWGIGLWGG